MGYTVTPNKGYKIPTVGTLAADWPNYIKETIEKIDVDLVGSIIPDADNTRDLGSEAKRYHAIHVNEVRAAVLYGNGANLTGITGATGGIANAGSTTIGADTDLSGDGIISLQTRMLDRLVVANNGDVGIGITNPTAALHISGSNKKIFINDTATSGATNFQIDAANSTKIAMDFSITNVISFQTYFGSWTNLLNFKNHKVGIGTTDPITTLHVSGGDVTIDSDKVIRFRRAWYADDIGSPILGHNGHAYTYLRSIDGDPSDGIAIQQFDGTTIAYFMQGGNVGIGTTNPTISGTGKLHLAGDTIRLESSRTPASAGAAGNQGEHCWDSDFLYVCVSANSWKRAVIAAW